MKYHLRILGHGYRYLYFNEEHYFTNKFKDLNIHQVNQILFDNELLSRKRILNYRANIVSHPEEADPTDKGCLYNTDLITRLEIKSTDTKRLKIRFYDLRNDELLFGLSNIKKTNFLMKGLLILEKSLGSFGKVTMETEKLGFSDLFFELTYLEMYKATFIRNVILNNKELSFRNDDLVCSSQCAYLF